MCRAYCHRFCRLHKSLILCSLWECPSLPTHNSQIHSSWFLDSWVKCNKDILRLGVLFELRKPHNLCLWLLIVCMQNTFSFSNNTTSKIHLKFPCTKVHHLSN
jgi:hypothetical protein